MSVVSIIVDVLGNEYKIGNVEIEGEGDSGWSKVGEESVCIVLVGILYFVCSVLRVVEILILDKICRIICVVNLRIVMFDERGIRVREGLFMRFVILLSSYMIRKVMLRLLVFFVL